MKKTFKIILWIIIIAGIIVVGGFINIEKKKTICKKFEVNINYDDSYPLITVDDIKDKVYKLYDSVVGKRLVDIDIEKIESIVNQVKYVAKGDVYTTLRGNLEINIIQRKPIVRIINRKNQSFYIDQTGVLFPLGKEYSARVIIANGNIKESLNDTTKLYSFEEFSELNIINPSTLQKIYLLATYIARDDFLKAQIEQIYVNKNSEFELTPKVGRHVIIFGDIDNMEKKFNKLFVFYKEGLNKTGWDKYKVINLKYDNQVVCSK
jgi:cell division protein FtsQ